MRLTPPLLHLSRVPLRDRFVADAGSVASRVVFETGAEPFPSPSVRSSSIVVASSSSLAILAISAGNFSLNRSFRSEYRKISLSACVRRGQSRMDMLFMLSKSFARTLGDGFW